MLSHRTAVSLATLATLAGFSLVGTPDVGAADPAKAARSCRKTVAAAVSQSAIGGVPSVVTCEGVGAAAKCDLNGASGFQQLVARGRGAITPSCPAGNPIGDLYPGGSIPDVVFPDVQAKLESLALQPLAAADKAKQKCRSAIAKARSAIMKGVVKSAIKCQSKLDKKATTFGRIAESCVNAPAKAAGKASKLIGKGCGGLSGADVGACDPLPGCAIDEATVVAREIAFDCYGGASVCGDGLQQLGEQCDDGNTVATDACTATCQLAKCGDGIVEAGVEECDEGTSNGLPGITCQDGCKLPVCGNGKLETGEECDDGNQTPGDGCTRCHIDGIPCGANGAAVTVTLVSAGISNIGGVRVDVKYPALVTIPGTGADQSVLDRVTLIQDALNSPNDHDTNQDGVDDTLTDALANVDPGLAPGVLETIAFSCTQGTALPPGQFSCTVSDASDKNGFPIPSGLSCTVSIQAQ